MDKSTWEWDPMAHDFADPKINSYRGGVGQDLQCSRRDALHGDRSVTLYVRGVPWGLSAAGLEKLFTDYGGKVVSAKIPQKQDASKYSANYAFVIMADATGAQEAIQNLHHFRIKDQTLNVQVALSKEEKQAREERKKREEEFMRSLNLSSDRGGCESESKHSSAIPAGDGLPLKPRGRAALLEESIIRGGRPGSRGDATFQNGGSPVTSKTPVPAKKGDKSKFQKQQGPPVGRGTTLDWSLCGSGAGRRSQEELSVIGSDAESLRLCVTCGGEAFSKCKRCKTPYCSRECQTKDWSEHSRICRELAEKRGVWKSPCKPPPVADMSDFDVDVGKSFIENNKDFFESILRAADEESESSSTGSYGTNKPPRQSVHHDRQQKDGRSESSAPPIQSQDSKGCEKKAQPEFPQQRMTSTPKGERKGLLPTPGDSARCQKSSQPAIGSSEKTKPNKAPPHMNPPVTRTSQVANQPLGDSPRPDANWVHNNDRHYKPDSRGTARGTPTSSQATEVDDTSPPSGDDLFCRRGEQNRDGPGNRGRGAKSGRGGGQRKSLTCHRCGEEGHMVKECPQQPGGGSPQKRSGGRNRQKNDVLLTRDSGDKWDTVPESKPLTPGSTPSSSQSTSPFTGSKMHNKLKSSPCPSETPKKPDEQLCLYIQHFELALAYDKALKQTLEQGGIQQTLRAPTKDDMVMCDFMGDLCRAQVTKVNGSMVDIYYIDYGNWEQKEISSLLPVPAELQGFPGLAIKCSLQVSPADGSATWPDSLKAELQQLMSPHEVFIATPLSKCGDAFIITLTRERDDLDITKHLIERDLARPFVDGRNLSCANIVSITQRLMAADLGSVVDELAVDKTRELVCSDIRTNFELSMHVEDKYDEFMRFSTDLHNTYTESSQSAAPYVPVVGELVAAKYSTSGEWCRAEVQMVDDSQVLVQYIDFGNSETLPLTQLQALRREHASLPAQSFQCAVVGIQHDRVWATEQMATFYQCFEAYSKNMKCLAEIKSKEAGLVWLDIIHPHKEQTLAEILLDALEESVLPQPLQPVAAPPTPPASAKAPILHAAATKSSPPCTALPTDVPVAEAVQDESSAVSPQSAAEPPQLPTAMLPLDTWVNCGIQVIYSCTRFYVNRMDVVDELEALRSALTSHCIGTSEQNTVGKVQAGDNVLTQYSADGEWYRARVESVSEDGTHCQVFFTDFGNAEQQNVASLRKIPSQFFQMAAQGICCSLSGASPSTPKEKDGLFKRFCEQRVVKLKALQCKGGVYEVVVVTASNQSVMDLLEGAVQPTDQPVDAVGGSVSPADQSVISSGQSASPVMPVPPPAGSPAASSATDNAALTAEQHQASLGESDATRCSTGRIPERRRVMLDSLQAATVDNREHEAFIVHVVSPAEFYCQTKAAAEEQAKLLEQLSAACASTDVLTDAPQVGEVLCCLFEGAWYRCVVTDVTDNLASVHFIDYGNDAQEDVSRLRPIPYDLCMKFPVGCFKCSLHGITAPEGGWSEVAGNSLRCLLTTAVMLKVEQQSEETHSVAIHFQGINLADDFVNNKFAVYEESQPEPEPAAPQESREELERMMLEIQRKLQSMN
ncbi:hypothetical protein BaRGS_00020470 [Batillaria attramentaria]|uniref:Tudor domain-containing protein 1 n=1 Tax=Batillaria attramentaria TaxID=370345 RepID=A0ABD0KMJ0_9CAEN